jgi:hypothetical protein
MKNKINSIMVLLFAASLFSSCVNDTFDEPLTEECVEPSLIKNKEVQDIYNISGNTPLLYGYSITDPNLGANDVIEAYVTSSDEGGNFFKTMSFIATDGSRGFSMSIDDYNLYTKKLQPGTKVYVKLKGLYHSLPSGFARGLAFGSMPTNIPDRVERIPTLEYGKYLFPTCTKVDENTFVKHITLAQAYDDALINSLVEIDDVQFETEGGTYDPNTTDTFDTNIYITNGTNSLAVRTSRFANFAGYTTPSGRGKIRGVLTRFGTSATGSYQLVLRTERDTRGMTNTRTDYSLPIVGNAIQYTGSFTENFESYTTTSPANRNFPKYINDPIIGSRFWANTIFGGNKYLQMTSFGGSAENNRSLFFVPVDMTAASTFSFQSKAGFHNGNVLKVYYILASDYTPGGIVNNANLVDITSNFTISPGLPSGYPTNFTSSGNYAIPASVTGNGYFVFEYVGSGVTGLTTTMQIDNIVVN